MVNLYNAHYQMVLECGGDIWCLHGESDNHPNKFIGTFRPSTPVSFDEEKDVLVTASGRVYKIMSYVNRPDTVAQIKQDIKNGGYEVH